MTAPVRVTHYSDLLCVWAYVAQVRVDELRRQFGDKVRVDTRFCGVFGDTPTRVGEGWKDRGGFAGYGAHVREVVERFEHCEIHPGTWDSARPKSSMPAHLYLCAVRQLADEAGDPELVFRTTWAFRLAFFAEGRDISDARVRKEVAAACGVDTNEAELRIADGRAHALLSSDLLQAREDKVSVSPTLIFNECRQTLAGNVGYRIIEANVAELLEQPAPAHSWC